MRASRSVAFAACEGSIAARIRGSARRASISRTSRGIGEREPSMIVSELYASAAKTRTCGNTDAKVR